MNSAALPNDTIVAPATPNGVGAIHLIRLSGPQAIALTAKYFKGSGPATSSAGQSARIKTSGGRFDLRKSKARRLYYGQLLDDNQQLLDEVVVSLYRAPASYTGEDTVEISCHGSPFISQAVVQLFIRAGARLAEPGEFSQRAFLNGKMDLSQTEAVADLIASQSAAAHRMALHQLKGGVSDAIGELRQKLIDFASLIELELDFAEEDVEFADRTELMQLVESIRTRIADLQKSFALGNAIKNGIATVIAGRPNAGKSTLLNALLQEERAIVSEVAGTTRDTIEEILNIEGVAFRLIDTAGIREASDKVEAIGVERTLAKVQESRILLYVYDVIATSPEQLAEDLNALYQEDTALLVVANKMDLNPYTSYDHYFGEEVPPSRWSVPYDNFVPIIAKKQANLDFLKERLYALGVGQDWQENDLILSNARHYAALQRADEDLEKVLSGMSVGVTSDFIAMDIRAALHHLGEIAGTVSTDDLLSNIFSKFCIGK